MMNVIKNVALGIAFPIAAAIVVIPGAVSTAPRAPQEAVGLFRTRTDRDGHDALCETPATPGNQSGARLQWQQD